MSYVQRSLLIVIEFRADRSIDMPAYQKISKIWGWAWPFRFTVPVVWERKCTFPIRRDIFPLATPSMPAWRFAFSLHDVKSSQVVGLRDRVAIIRALLHAISSPRPTLTRATAIWICVGIFAKANIRLGQNLAERICNLSVKCWRVETLTTGSLPVAWLFRHYGTSIIITTGYSF